MKKKFAISHIDTTNVNLIKDVDYKILTFRVMYGDFNFSPYGRFFGIDYEKIKTFDQEEMEALARATNKPFFSLGPSLNHEVINEIVFEIIGQNEIDINVAVDCGFGVLEIIDGVLKGFRYLYDETGDPDDESYEEDFNTRVTMYLLATEPTFDTRFFESYLEVDPFYIGLLLGTNDGWLIGKIKDAYKQKKGRIIQFPIRNQ